MTLAIGVILVAGPAPGVGLPDDWRLREPISVVVSAAGEVGRGPVSDPVAAQVVNLVRRALNLLATAIPAARTAVVIVVLEPNHPAFLDTVGSSTEARQWVAATVGSGGVQRIEIDRDAFARLTGLGRQVVLTHELVHWLVRPQARGDAPLWIQEGVADVFAFADSGLSAAAITDGVLHGLPGTAELHLPGDGDFAAGGRRQEIAYAMAWLACELIAQRVGNPGLLRFAGLVDGSQASVAEPLHSGFAPFPGPSSVGQTPERALLAVTGETMGQFEARWRAAVGSLAAA